MSSHYSDEKQYLVLCQATLPTTFGEANPSKYTFSRKGIVVAGTGTGTGASNSAREKEDREGEEEEEGEDEEENLSDPEAEF